MATIRLIAVALVLLAATIVLGASQHRLHVKSLISAITANKVATSEPNPNWAQKLYDVLQARDSLVGKLNSLTEEQSSQTIEDLLNTLQTLPPKLIGIDNLDTSILEKDRELVRKLLTLPEKPIVSSLFQSINLESYYSTRGLGFMMKTFKAYHDGNCIKALYSPPQPFKGYKLPLKYMCIHVKKELGKQKEYIFSTSKICTNTKQCAGASVQFPYGDSDGTDIKTACSEGDTCNVEKALPMMGGLLWYKVSAFIAQSLCHNYLDQPPKSSLNSEHEDIGTMRDLIMAYTSTLHWSDFFTKAVEVRAYSDLEKSLTLVEERILSVEFASLACIELQSDDMCTVGDIYKTYKSLKKLQKDRLNPGPTRNLRRQANVDHRKMLELKKEAKKHIDLLGNIHSLDNNLRTAVTGISKYFYGLAKYDEGIANQDVVFISGKLSEFQTKSRAVSLKLEKDIQNAMTAMIGILGAQFLEESLILTAKIAENMNPAKAIFGGVSVGDIYEQAAEVARAGQELVHGIALQSALYNVLLDSADLARDFRNNANQIANLQKMVDAIKTNTVEEIGYDADKFIKAYGDYTPKVGRARLAKNDALWAAFKGAACDLLNGAQGVGAAVGQGVVNGMLLCEKLEGTLAEFGTLRENIFDFQFDLVDSLAAVVRGNIAKKLSKNIKVSNDLLEASKLMLGFFMTEYRLQSEAALYCDKLEYMYQVKELRGCKACEPETGFFTDNNLDAIIGFRKEKVTYFSDERFVYIPTKPQFEGDTGFINLPSLAEGNPVTFRLPTDKKWLRKYNWLGRGEVLAPYVESFKLYLPLKTYKTNDESRQSVKTRVRLISIAGSMLKDTSDVVYNLPHEHGSFLTVYYEGFTKSRCPIGKEIPNPYSLCDNLPKICDTITKVPQESMLPTILSTWKLSYTVETGDQDLTWDAPNPATNLLIIGKVKLRFLTNPGKKRGLSYHNDALAFGCCTGNKYRPKWSDSTCEPCPSKPPTDSIAKLRGYYCEKGSEPVTGNSK